MRDIAVFLLFVGLLPLCLLRPWVGILVFSFLAYNRTQDLTYTFARTLPISQSVAIALIVGWILFEFRPLLRRDARLRAMVLLVLIIGVSMFSNTVRWDYQWNRYTELAKIILIALLTSALCVTRARLRQIMLVVALGLGFYGFKNGLSYFLLGTKTIIGPGGMLVDNNDFALAMVMNLPILWYVSNDVHDMRLGRVLKPAMRVIFFCTFITIIATGSRGAFLATGAAVGWMVWKTRYKVPAMVAALVLGAVAWVLAPAEYKERITSMFQTRVADLDQSAQGRLVSWAVARNMIEGNPLFGVGFNNMIFEYHRYMEGVTIPEGYATTRARVAHNSYLQIWAESGTLAYLTFMFIILSTIGTCWLRGRKLLNTPDRWGAEYYRAIECTMIAFLVGATFLNRAHFDLVYQIVAVAAALPAVVASESRGVEAPRRWGRRRAGRVTVDGRTVEVGAR